MTRGLNGETVLKLDDVLVGYVPGDSYGYKNKLRLTVDVHMERLDRQDTYETTAHEQVSRPLDFAITYGVWQPSRRDIVSGGAGVAEALDEITEYARGWDAGKVAELRELTAYHLNAMSAGCDHQTPVIEKDRYGREVPSLDKTPACPVTGYKYGHAWLVRELPEGFERRVHDLFGA